ncbi:MAG TPA: ATP-binding protein [Pedobacter sp.]|nr:ATP-binding protein [Pedobacter sp.]
MALRLAINAANFGTWFIHSVSREFVTDARLKELFGYHADEDLSIEAALAQISEEYRNDVADKLEKAINGNGDYDVTYPVVGLHDKRLRWLRAIGNLKADPSGAFSAFTGVVMDVTEQQQSAQKIERAEEGLRMAIESGELAVWHLDQHLGKIVASHRFHELFGFESEEEVSFESAINQIDLDYQQVVRDAVAASFANGANFNVEYPVTGLLDHKKRWVRSVGKYVKDEKNGDYITGVMADITEPKMDEMRKNDFIGMVSHELKTPLTSMKGYIQVLLSKQKQRGDLFTAGLLEKANTQIAKMTNMINGFLNVSRLESGKIHMDVQIFDFAVLVKEAEDESLATITSHTVAFEPVPSTFVNADRDKVGQVIHNLISNAVKYAPAGSVIGVSCVTTDGLLRLSVKDSGMGINPDDLSKIFDRYYRVEGNQMHSISGFGIGLYLCREIIQRHHGEISAESEIGKGSTFTFTLPCIKQSY